MSGKLVKVWALVKFLKEHEGVWCSPHEIRKELGRDIRTVYKMIRELSRRPLDTTKGWRLDVAERGLDVAERGKRIFCVRMEREMEDSGNLVEAKVSEVEDNLFQKKITSDNYREDYRDSSF